MQSFPVFVPAWILIFVVTSVLTMEGASVVEDGDDFGGNVRSLFVYEKGKQEPWSTFNVAALVLCLTIGAALALCCLWCRHHQSEEVLVDHAHTPFHS